MEKLTLYDLNFKDKKALMRVDFNVPISKGIITDDTRLVESLPSIQYILSQGGSLILMSHLGRPTGKQKELSLAPIAKHLSNLLHQPVKMAPDCIGPEVEKMAHSLHPKEVLLLENLRFYPGEEHPDQDPSFAEKLARLGDLYINDAFGTAHRKHASTATIARFFPHKAALGFLMEKELSFLEPLISHPKRPFYALIGGAKISTKIGVLESLISKIDALFIGGGMAFTFLKAKGYAVGDSLCDESFLKSATSIMKKCEEKAVQLFLPQDIVISKGSEIKTVEAKEIPQGWKGMDIGPKTLNTWEAVLKKGSTLFWNGPMGVFEEPQFAKGTHAVAKILSGISAVTIVGGGDSVAAIKQMGLQSHFTHLSSGGGATLEYIEYGTLPGIEALS